MHKLRYIILTVLIISNALLLNAQNREVSLKLSTGYNSPFGFFAATSVETIQPLYDNFRINGGLRYSSIGKFSAETRPEYFKYFNWGRVSAEALIAYTNLTSVSNLSFGAGVGISGKWIGLKLGYYYRQYGNKEGWIKEPVNIYYELSGNFLPMIEDWDLVLLITNSELCELDRHYQPSFIAQCSHYPGQHLGLNFGICCKPAGMFNMSADYYESYLKLGVSYRW